MSTRHAIKNMKTIPSNNLPTVKVMSRVQHSSVSADESVSETICNIYSYSYLNYLQGNQNNYGKSVTSVSKHKNECMEAVIDCLKGCVKQQHVSLLTDILTVLATHGWNRTESHDFAYASLQM